MTFDALQNDLLSAPKIDWDFLLDAPLRIVVIIIIAIGLNIVMRLFIRRFSTAVAKGTVGSEKAEGHGSGKFSSSVIESQRTGIEPVIIRERRAQRAKTVGRMLSSVTTIIISVIAVLMVLDQLNFNIAPILASAGIVGVALAFGAQELVKDYLSGFFMVIEDQYGIGDTVDLGEAVGEVEDFGLRKTAVRDLTGTLWHVRNGEIMRVGNLSQGWARAVLEIPVNYSTAMDTYREITESVTNSMLKDKELASAILERPEIAGVQSLSAEYRVIRTMIKTKPNLQWMVERAFRAELTHEFDTRGITIPIIQETMLRTLPDTSDAPGPATTGAARDSARPSAADRRNSDESPSPLPSDDEIRATTDEAGSDTTDGEN
ncbi:small conductance mechanosensitive channel [Brevibacterium sp. 239c]|uniref:mechanosensitive ion channel family protein n=1 Tax=Brevibacterium sp. 239c TaxID=1965356 RepID=UPI000C6C26E0|nr:mechanosensitive ion channel family protein [Brevibacterium sp. 239c]SMX88174.1 small conductance mechanosensitive channel [Brevibacterium sp. 239c]